MGRKSDLSARSRQETGPARLHGRHLPRRVRGRGPRLCRILHHHRRTFTRGWFGRHHRRRAHVALFQSHLQGRVRRAEAEIFNQTYVGRVDWLLVSDRARGRIGRGRNPQHCRSRRCLLGAQRIEDVHHQRPLRGHLRGDGDDGPRSRRGTESRRSFWRRTPPRTPLLAFAPARKRTSLGYAPARPAK